MSRYEFGDDKVTAIKETTFAEAKIKARDDLPRLLREQIEVIVGWHGADGGVLELGGFETAGGFAGAG